VFVTAVAAGITVEVATGVTPGVPYVVMPEGNDELVWQPDKESIIITAAKLKIRLVFFIFNLPFNAAVIYPQF
jgi:hypothetical protein